MCPKRVELAVKEEENHLFNVNLRNIIFKYNRNFFGATL